MRVGGDRAGWQIRDSPAGRLVRLAYLWHICRRRRSRFPCNQLGYYGAGGFTTLGDAATRVEVGDADATGIEIRLPDSPDQLLPARVGGYFCGGPTGQIS